MYKKFLILSDMIEFGIKAKKNQIKRNNPNLTKTELNQKYNDWYEESNKLDYDKRFFEVINLNNEK